MDEFLDVSIDLDFGKFEFRDLLTGRKKIVDELQRLGPGGKGVTAEHEQRYDALLERAEKLELHINHVEKGEKRSQRVAALATGSRTAPAPSGAPAGIPFRGDEPEERDLLANVDGGRVKYSLLRAVDLVSRNKPLDGLEGEVSAEIEKRSGKAATGFYIPWDLPVYGHEQRAAFNTTGGAGMIPTIQGRSIVDILRNKMLMSRLGATVMTDMVGIFDLPKKTGTGAAYWVTESGEPTESNPVIGQIPFSPTTVGTYSDVTRRLVKQSSFSAEQVVRDDLLSVLILEMDRVGFNGSGTRLQLQ